jgi:hypothetical protein
MSAEEHCKLWCLTVFQRRSSMHIAMTIHMWFAVYDICVHIKPAIFQVVGVQKIRLKILQRLPQTKESDINAAVEILKHICHLCRLISLDSDFAVVKVLYKTMDPQPGQAKSRIPSTGARYYATPSRARTSPRNKTLFSHQRVACCCHGYHKFANQDGGKFTEMIAKRSQEWLRSVLAGVDIGRTAALHSCHNHIPQAKTRRSWFVCFSVFNVKTSLRHRFPNLTSTCAITCANCRFLYSKTQTEVLNQYSGSKRRWSQCSDKGRCFPCCESWSPSACSEMWSKLLSYMPRCRSISTLLLPPALMLHSLEACLHLARTAHYALACAACLGAITPQRRTKDHATHRVSIFVPRRFHAERSKMIFWCDSCPPVLFFCSRSCWWVSA